MIDWAYVKRMLELSDDSQESYEKVIPTAISIIQRETGRDLVAQDYEKRLSGNGKDYIVLPQYPVNTLELKVDSTRAFTDDSIISNSLYILEEESGIVTLFSDKFPIDIATVKASFNAGFVSVPEDLKEAALEITKWIHNRLDSYGEGIGRRDLGADGMTSTTEMVLPLHVTKTLVRYTP